METPDITEWLQKLMLQVGETATPMPDDLATLLAAAMVDCRQLYRLAADKCVSSCPELDAAAGDDFRDALEQLHRDLLVKILVEIAYYDRDWTDAELFAAQLVLAHVQRDGQRNYPEDLELLVEESKELTWLDVVRPFAELPVLHDEIVSLSTNVMRIANLIAKAGGTLRATESMALYRIHRELDQALPIDLEYTPVKRERPQATDRLDEIWSVARPRKGTSSTQPSRRKSSSHAVREQTIAESVSSPPTPEQEEPAADEVDREQQLKNALQQLDELIGLEPVKQQVHELVDFIKLQKSREKLEIPTTQVTLHSVFEGNPGTGKTTVARLVGEIFAGLEILARGHTVEADRANLVAEFAGQTGPKTHKLVDEALDGVLFVDEAYSLVAKVDDAFGVEAVQALLKRMEDDRERLVVVLAGYPRPMDKMLKSNPGLSSRFQYRLQFPDYSAGELVAIFKIFCKKNHYTLTPDAEQRLLSDFEAAVAEKDEHFGNGRLARNLFEKAIRRMATRVVAVTPVTRELLTEIHPVDIGLSEAGEMDPSDDVGLVDTDHLPNDD